MGYLDQHPIADLEQPRAGKRELVLSQHEFDRVLSLIPCREFRDLLTITWETGCRPQEIADEPLRQIDQSVVRLQVFLRYALAEVGQNCPQASDPSNRKGKLAA